MSEEATRRRSVNRTPRRQYIINQLLHVLLVNKRQYTVLLHGGHRFFVFSLPVTVRHRDMHPPALHRLLVHV